MANSVVKLHEVNPDSADFRLGIVARTPERWSFGAAERQDICEDGLHSDHDFDMSEEEMR